MTGAFSFYFLDVVNVWTLSKTNPFVSIDYVSFQAHQKARFSLHQQSVIAQIARHVLAQAGPQLAGLDAVLAYRHEHGLVILGLGQTQQGLVIGIRRFTSLLVREVVTPNPTIEPLEAIEDQGVDGVARSKGELVMQTVIELRIRFRSAVHRIGATQYLGGLLRIVADRATDEDGADIGASRQQLGHQIRYLVLIQTGQSFQDVETRGLPEIVHLGRFAMLDGEPAITGQTLQHFAQGSTSHPDQLGQLALGRQYGSWRKAIVPDGLDDVFLGKPCRALRFYDHVVTLL